MFRNTTKSNIDPKHFGAGSGIKDGNDYYFVISNGSDAVALILLSTFTMVDGWVLVDDPNFLTEDEARVLVGTLGCAFSDCECFAVGLKDIKALNKDVARSSNSSNGCGINKF